MLTQVPHQYPQDLLPVGRHLASMANFAGMLEYLSSWVWREEGVVACGSGCVVSTTSLPLLIDDIGQPISLGECVAGRLVFATEADYYRYLLEIAARDLQYRGFRDDRVANFRHDNSVCDTFTCVARHVLFVLCILLLSLSTYSKRCLSALQYFACVLLLQVAYVRDVSLCLINVLC